MADLCTDNRFGLIEKYKQKLIEATNIESRKCEMALLDDILFRFWQMGWLDRLEMTPRIEMLQDELRCTNYRNEMPVLWHSLL